MDRRAIILLLSLISCCGARLFCDGTYRPLEVGKWKTTLTHLDSGVVENKPVTMDEGQVYVYENEFPGYTIKYIHVDNLAIRTCGASAEMKAGGLGKSSVLIIIRANANNEIRSVVDIWGVKNYQTVTKRPLANKERKNIKSLYLLNNYRTVNHNNINF